MNALPEHIAQGRRQILQSKTELSVLGPGPYVTSSGPLERAFQELQVQPGSSCPPGQVGARKEADPGKAPSAMPGPQDPVLHGDAFHSFVHLPIHQSVRPSIRPCRRPLSNTSTCYASCQVMGVTVSAWEQIPCFKRGKEPIPSLPGGDARVESSCQRADVPELQRVRMWALDPCLCSVCIFLSVKGAS